MADEVDISLCITTRGKEWLLQRTVQVLAKQQVDPSISWEVVVIDDNSDVPIAPYLNPLKAAGIEVRTFRLDHSDGWRGITVGMMEAFKQARGRYVAESNSHLLLPRNAVNLLYFAHVDPDVRKAYCEITPSEEAVLQDAPEKLWVSMRPFNLTTEATIKMDQTFWREDLVDLWTLPETADPWTRLWTRKFDGMEWNAGDNANQRFGTHLICSIRKDAFFQLNPWGDGFKDYGTDDPAYAGARQRAGILDLNIWTPEDAVAHMAHNNHFEDAMELVPTGLNRKGHTAVTAQFWDTLEEQKDFIRLEEVIAFWERGERTTDWRIRDAWGWANQPPAHYITVAKEYLKQGKTTLKELL